MRTWIEQDDGSQTTQFGQIKFHFPHFRNEFRQDTIKNGSNASLVGRVPEQNNNQSLIVKTR